MLVFGEFVPKSVSVILLSVDLVKVSPKIASSGRPLAREELPLLWTIKSRGSEKRVAFMKAVLFPAALGAGFAVLILVWTAPLDQWNVLANAV